MRRSRLAVQRTIMRDQAIRQVPMAHRREVIHESVMSDRLDSHNPIKQERTKRVALDVDDVVSRYQSGQSVIEIAATLGGSPETVRRRLRDRGVLRSVSESLKVRAATPEGLAQIHAAQRLAIVARNRDDLDAARDDIIIAYLAGASTKALGERYSCGSSQIAAILTDAGVEIRDKSAAGRLRASRIPAATKAEFYRRVAVKNRGRTRPDDATRRSAATKYSRLSQNIGVGEEQVAERLAVAGFGVDRQVSVDRYNIDITASGVAVEIHSSMHGPHLDRGITHRRIDHLTDRGWRILYVWGPRGINPSDLEQIVTLVKELRRNPSTPGQYTVLRCEGNSRPRRGANRYQGAFVATTRKVSDAGG